MADRPRAILYDDQMELAPLTDLRAPYEVRTGALTLLERLSAPDSAVEVVGLHARDGLAAVVAERAGLPVNGAAGDGVLLVNGRLTALPEGAADLAPDSALVREDGVVAAARVDGGAAAALLVGEPLPVSIERRVVGSAPMLEAPWDVVRHRDASLRADLAAMVSRGGHGAPEGVSVVGDGGVRVEPSATLMPGVVLDATRGPVVIGAGAIVRPNAVISGPAYVGPGSTVLDNAQLWGGVALGPVCKVGGEVNGTIFQGHANKAHEGFLGDSWLGEWVNLGAGTVTSNLLNTYGEITTVSADGLRRRTGLRFLGAIIGDHAKTAIGTRLMTGTMVGTGAMIALSKPPPTAVPSFAWLTESRTLVYRLSRFLEVAETVMARRSRSLGDAERARLRALHEAESSRFIVPPIDFQI